MYSKDIQSIITIQLSAYYKEKEANSALVISDFCINWKTYNSLSLYIDASAWLYFNDCNLRKSIDIKMLKPELFYNQFKNDALIVLHQLDSKREWWFFNYLNKNEILAKLSVDLADNNWQLVFNKKVKIIRPLLYPWGIVSMMEAALYYKQFFIHAAGLNWQKKGILICGFSGAGKTTLSGLLAQEGAQLLNDDRMLINTENLTMHNHPMLYEQNPMEGNLNALFFIRHGENEIRKLSKQEAALHIFSEIIFPQKNLVINKELLQLSIKVAVKINVWQFSFRPNKSAVELLKSVLV
jgi:serine kinase of HPr protein (carbohydrate metabolism regulator)